MDAPLTLASLGEDAVVSKLLRLLPALPSSVVTGAGDDCAVVQHSAGAEWSLLKADSVVEGVHFLAGEPMARVGWKALCRAVSDVAAMGGTPEHALITLALAPATPWSDLQDLYKGIRKAARRFGVSVVGGETGKTRGPMVCSVFLTGRVSPEQCVRRSGGSPGDVLLVTGRLGGSFESGRHLDFVPRLKEARWLVENFRPTAMMDLSDGLAADAPRLARASGCGVALDPAKVPRNRGCTLEQACSDGEDFELLFSISPSSVQALLKGWKTAFPGVPLSVIGSLAAKSAGLQPSWVFQKGGYDHFQ